MPNRQMFELDEHSSNGLISEQNGSVAFKKGVAKFGGFLPTSTPEKKELQSFFDESTGCCNISRKNCVYALNCVCCVVHFFFFVLTFALGANKADKMHVALYRTEAVWTGSDSNGFNFTTIKSDDQFFYIHTMSSMFFFLSFLAHAVWVVLGQLDLGYTFLWSYLRDCMSYWRWIEYSMSASLMLVCLAVSVAVRDVYILLCVFSLNFVTMLCGFATELFSRPSAASRDGAGNAMSYDRKWWQGQASDMIFYHKLQNYMYRMIPHFSGYFPYFVAWWCVYAPLFDTIADAPSDSDIPAWVLAALIGTFAVFTCFAFTQLYYQWQPPERYWESEVVYCLLSLFAKSYLGVVLLVNVITASGGFDASTSS